MPFEGNILQKIESNVICITVVALLLCGANASAQITSGDIVGYVIDSSGASVSGASVKLTNTDTRAIRSSFSGNDGTFTFTELQPGMYEINVSASGFTSFTEKGILLQAGDRKRVEVKLQPGAITQTINVAATVSALQTDNTTVGSSLQGKVIQNLPINGRNVYSLVQVAPGVNAGNPNSQMSGYRPADRRQSSSVSANGQFELYNNNLIDGMDNNERMKGLIFLRPSIEAIDQVSVITNLSSADVTRALGAVVDLFTKSGTNQFHGSAYEFFRNDITDARNFFASTSVLPHKPELRQNQFGGSLSGPLIRDRMFFFVDVEKLRQIDANNTVYTSTVPTLYEEQHPGDLSDIHGPVIPLSRIDPTALAYFKLYPAPNQPGTLSGAGAPIDNYLSNPPISSSLWTGDFRLDHHFTVFDQAFLRYSYNGLNTATPAPLPIVNGVYAGGTLYGTYPGSTNIITHNAQLAYTHIFSANLVGSFRADYTLFNNNQIPWNYGRNLNQSPPFLIPNANNCTACSGLIPVTPAPGYAALGDPTFLPLFLDEHVYQTKGDLNYTHGTQTIKMGASFIHREAGNLQQPNGKGTITFTGSTPQQALAKFFVGAPFNYTRQTVLEKLYVGTNEIGMYVQDDWRVRSNLMLTLGARYDIFTPAKEQNGNYSNLNLSTFQLDVSSTGGIKTSYVDLAPRLGFAWTINNSTVIRGGFGLIFMPDDIGNSFFLLNPPYSYASGNVTITSPISAGVIAATAPSTNTLSGSIAAKTMNWLNAYAEQFNFLLQKDFHGNTLTLGYLGTMGKHLLEQVGNLDLPLPSGSSVIPAQPFALQLPNVNTIQYYGDFGDSNYNAFEVGFDRYLNHGIAVHANYTWAHAIDDYLNTQDGEVAVGLIPTAISTYDKGNSALDVRHRVAVTANYVLPELHLINYLSKAILSGWQLNLLGFWQTGLPFSISDAVTQGPSNLAFINLPTVRVDRPDVVGSVSVPAGSDRLVWFNPSAFGPQAVGTAGNAGRNQLYGPPFRRTDVSLFRNFPISEKVNAEFRLECFNISNTPNFAPPGGQITAFSSLPNANGRVVATNAGNFGIITSTATGTTGRQFQFALRLLF